MSKAKIYVKVVAEFTPEGQLIRSMCRMDNIDEKEMYQKAKMLLSIYRRVCWSTVGRVDLIADEMCYYCGSDCTRSIASTSKIKSRLTAALVINSFESRPADLVTTVTDHPERTGRYHPYVSESLLRDIRSNHTVLGCLPLLFPQCCR